MAKSSNSENSLITVQSHLLLLLKYPSQTKSSQEEFSLYSAPASVPLSTSQTPQLSQAIASVLFSYSRFTSFSSRITPVKP